MNAQSLIQRAISYSSRGARKSTLAIVTLLVAASVHAQTSITFDEVSTGTLIDNAYAGLTLSNPLGGNVYTSSGWHANSGMNTVSITLSRTTPFNARDGAVDVNFATPQLWASIDAAAFVSLEALGTPVARPFIEAYDSKNNLVARSYFQGALPSPNSVTPYETMAVSQPTATIKRIRFSVQIGTPPVYGLFDNLKFSTVAAPFCSARLKQSGGC